MTELWLIPIMMYSAYFAIITPVSISVGGDWGGLGAVLIGHMIMILAVIPIASAIFGIRAAIKRLEGKHCFFFALVNLAAAVIPLGAFSLIAFAVSLGVSFLALICTERYLEDHPHIANKKKRYPICHPTIFLTSPNLIHTIKIQEWEDKDGGGASIHCKSIKDSFFKKVGSVSCESWASPFKSKNYDIEWGENNITLHFFSGDDAAQSAEDKSTWESVTLELK